MDLSLKLQLAYKKLSSAKRVLVIGHTSPDADALASMGAMIEVIDSLGVSFYAYADRKPNGAYDFIENESFITSEEPADLRIFDVILILDCGSISRTNLELRLRSLIKAAQEDRIKERAYIIEIDHHEKMETYADLEIRDADKASTTEIVYHFLKDNALKITRSLADSILIGLMTDTGHFLHANSSREALAVSSEMLLRGASLPKIINKTIHNKSFSSLKVWGRVLENMKFDEETGFASSALLESEIKELMSDEEKEAQVDMFGDIVSFMSCLSGVQVALLLREDGGRVKGSLRTNLDSIDVAKIAQSFGGGGHKKSAGFSITGCLEATNNGWKVLKFNK